MNTHNDVQTPDKSDDDTCPTCGAPLTDIIETKTGRRLRRCTKGSWNPGIRKTEGCPYVKWLPYEPQALDEKCPKCGSPLVLDMTRFGRKMKKCSTGGWDREKRVAIGCDYIEWITGTTQELSEHCPQCGEKLVLYTTVKGKKMKKCSTAGWDKEKRQPTGCTYVEWIREDTGEEFLPTSEGSPIPEEEP